MIPGIFHLTLVYNPGIAFGLFRQYENILLIIITLSLVVLFFWATRLTRSSHLLRTALALILGGATGNWLDRIRIGAVIDFFDFRVWPVFNVADSSISVGVGLYLIYFFTRKRKEKT